MKFRTKLQLCSEKLWKLSRIMACTFIIFVSVSNVNAAENRFKAPVLNAPLDDFTKRVESGIFNSDFLVAHLLNNARQIQRDGNDLANNLSSVFTEQFNNSAISNSVIVPPGTKADTIIVINQNDGDSFAIQR